VLEKCLKLRGPEIPKVPIIGITAHDRDGEGHFRISKKFQGIRKIREIKKRFKIRSAL
jgi:hypothetical protein